jgi:hypothetical protein
VRDQVAFFGPNALCVAVETGVMLRPIRNCRKRRTGTDLSAPTNDPVYARHLPVQMVARIIEAMTSSARDHIAQKNEPASATANWT